MRPKASGLLAEDISSEIVGTFAFLNGVLSKKEWKGNLKIKDSLWINVYELFLLCYLIVFKNNLKF